MTNNEELIARYQQSLMDTFGTPPVALVRGKGTRVWDSDGREYLDFLAGIAVNSLGHAHPAILSALTKQANQLMHVSNFYATESQIQAAEKILSILSVGEPAHGRVFFTNSGTEANEAAFKMIRLHGGVDRPIILALENSFHGRTMGSLALTWNKAYRAPFEPLPGGVRFISATIPALEQAFASADSGAIAGMIVEPIQGEAGVKPLPPGFLARARQLTLAADALLVVDEVQTGIGRTGTWMCYHQEDPAIVPDIVTLAKGLGGGFPVGACVSLNDKANAIFSPGAHGTTFGGNPLASAAVLAVLDTIVAEDILTNVQVQGQYLSAQITHMGSSLIEQTRGKGLLLGIGLSKPIAKDIARALFARGVIVNAPNPSTLRLAPPLNVTRQEIDQFLAIFMFVIAGFEGG